MKPLEGGMGKRVECRNTGIHHVGLRAANPAASAEFYRDVLGMEIVGGTGPDRPLGASAFLCYTRPCPSPLNILKLIICGPIQLFPLLPTVCPDEGRLKPSRHRLPDCPLFCWHS